MFHHSLDTSSEGLVRLDSIEIIVNVVTRFAMDRTAKIKKFRGYQGVFFHDQCHEIPRRALSKPTIVVYIAIFHIAERQTLLQ